MALSVLFFPSIWPSSDPQTLQNKGKRKMTNRPCFTPPPPTGGAKKGVKFEISDFTFVRVCLRLLALSAFWDPIQRA